MSDAYTINGVTVTPTGGGFYELSHPNLPEPVRARGKENADAKAAEIGAMFLVSEDSMPKQNLDEAVVSQPDITVVGDGSAARIAALEAQVAALLARPVQTVVTDGGAAPEPLRTGPIPSSFTGQVDKDVAAAAAKLGIKYVTIRLEENSDIPPTGLYVGHNGRGYVISPGVPVDVPDFLLEILDNAVMSAPIVDGTTKKVLGYRNRMRYPYHRL